MLYKLAVWGVAMAASLAPHPRQMDVRLLRITSQVRRETALIAMQKLPGGPPPARGWMNRHPVAVYTVIILVTLVVGAITLRLLRNNGRR